MEDIRLYDFEFDLKHIENDIVSANWTLYYNDVGTFEAHFNTDSDVVLHILNNPYLVAVQGDQQAIISCTGTYQGLGSIPNDDIDTYIEGAQTGIYKWEGLLDGGSESGARTKLAKKAWSKEVQTKTRDCGIWCGLQVG